MSQRLCPNCRKPMQEKGFHGQQVDFCLSCGGMWFDLGELDSILHLVKLCNSVELNEPEIDTTTEIEGDRLLHCPHDGSVMDKTELGGSIIDICPRCEGIWLDSGEIRALKLAERHIRENIRLYIRLGQ